MPGKRFLKRAALLLLLLAGLLLAAWFGLRNMILQKTIATAEAKVKEKYHANLAIQEGSFTGFAGLSFVGISLVADGKDTLLTADTVSVSISFTSLLTGRIQLRDITAETISLNLVKTDSTSNYADFLHPKRDTATTAPGTKDYASLFNFLLKKFFHTVPASMHIKLISLHTAVDGKKEYAAITILKNSDTVACSLTDSTNKKTWKSDGTIDRSKKTIHLNCYGVSDAAYTPLPFAESFAGMRLQFDTIALSLDETDYHKHRLSLKGKIEADGLTVHHAKISTEDVVFKRLSYDYHFTVTEKSIIADTMNVLQLNDLSAYAGFSISNDTYKEYSLDLHTDYIPATDFFSSLPKGIFNNFEGMKADGNLKYIFHFKLNTERPDSVEFVSYLKKDKFRIKKYGVTNFAMLNGDFLYISYEHDRPFRTIDVSLANLDYVPLQNITPYFRNAVLTSEDGSFFYHNGFNEEAFKRSIAENYKAGRFVRGGSTITMQLVKNVFLSRHKTIARKAEEALIVWLIESNRIVSKERMMEVYLNIIELGPGIYGVNEAARFYFNKKAADLTLSESIFLASLLPHPKWFKYSFDKTGTLKPYFADYFRVVSNFLLRKELITQEEYDKLRPEIILKGSAKNAVMPLDSIPVDLEEE